MLEGNPVSTQLRQKELRGVRVVFNE